MDSSFEFKQFSVCQDKAAMKIGTDAVLLGAWIELDYEPEAILDVGTGTGVIALIMAQRFPNTDIEAVEIDTEAYQQAVENFENSSWGDRLFGYHASFQEFFQEVEDQLYDVIISNPPFFSPNHKSSDDSRNLARFEDALPLQHLFHGASKLLSEEGVFVLILPFEKEEEAIDIAKQMHLLPQRITRVKGTPDSNIKRSLLQFGFHKKDCLISELVIETTRHNYTQDYKDLVKDFYLKM